MPVRKRSASLRIAVILLDNGQPIGQAQVAGKVVLIVIRRAAFINDTFSSYQTDRPSWGTGGFSTSRHQSVDDEGLISAGKGIFFSLMPQG